jgi:hypothetical protein
MYPAVGASKRLCELSPGFQPGEFAKQPPPQPLSLLRERGFAIGDAALVPEGPGALWAT